IQKVSSGPALEQAVRPTTLLEVRRLAKLAGVDLRIATETFQHTGSFKFRAAFNLVNNVPQSDIITASSGNFGQAVAFACSLLGKRCTIVMPSTSARVKIDSVREYGGTVDLVDVRGKSRQQRVSELALEKPGAFIASAYDDDYVIEGNASLGREISSIGVDFDAVVAPVGGGGLTSGIIMGIRQSRKNIKVFGAEPLLANDAARSLKAGRLIKNDNEPQTIADGARTVSLGQRNWRILRDGISGIVEVPEDQIKEGVRVLFSLANLKVEPTGALAVGALLTNPDLFKGMTVCCVVSGGNVDPDTYASILKGDQ
ncbi:MAG TPA: pyridoxal-phosphate dependent enzyme, partial [Blastocatellia bacterium]